MADTPEPPGDDGHDGHDAAGDHDVAGDHDSAEAGAAPAAPMTPPLSPGESAPAAQEKPQYAKGVAAVLRAARYLADLSQRELAAKAGVSCGLIGDLEAGNLASPRLLTLDRILRAAGCRLVVVDGEGRLLQLRPFDDARDRGYRRFPAHLEVREVKDFSDWWGTWALPQRELPPHTADWRRNRGRPKVRRPPEDRAGGSRSRRRRARRRNEPGQE